MLTVKMIISPTFLLSWQPAAPTAAAPHLPKLRNQSFRYPWTRKVFKNAVKQMVLCPHLPSIHLEKEESLLCQKHQQKIIKEWGSQKETHLWSIWWLKEVVRSKKQRLWHSQMKKIQSMMQSAKPHARKLQLLLATSRKGLLQPYQMKRVVAIQMTPASSSWAPTFRRNHQHRTKTVFQKHHCNLQTSQAFCRPMTRIRIPILKSSEPPMLPFLLTQFSDWMWMDLILAYWVMKTGLVPSPTWTLSTDLFLTMSIGTWIVKTWRGQVAGRRIAILQANREFVVQTASNGTT